jgi:maleylpyruvate isomerase
MDDLVLHGCWRSSASHRLQIGLRLKQLPFRYVPVNLDRGEQNGEAFRAINPRGELPVLVVNGEPWFQSLSILEALEERHPRRGLPLLPDDLPLRRRCRELAEAINSSLQPLLLPARLRRPVLEATVEAGRTVVEKALAAGIRAYQRRGLDEIDRWLAGGPGPFCLGDEPTLADVLLVPQLEGALRLGIDLNPCARLLEVHAACMALPAFAEAEPTRMPDAPATGAAPSDQRQGLLAHKDPRPALAHYLSEVANTPIPGLQDCRARTLQRFAVVASKMTSLDGCLLLRWLCRSRGVRRVLEIGVFTGSSSLAILDGLPPDGELVAIDCEPTFTAVAEPCWQAVGRRERVTLHLGDALTEMARLSPGFDLIYVDADNREYLRYLEAALPLLAPGGLLVFDNVLWRGRVVAPEGDPSAISLDRLNRELQQRPDLECTVLSLSDGLALVQRRQSSDSAAR